MPKLEILLLGTFAVRHGGKLVTGLEAPRVQALLAYLLVHRHGPQSRTEMASRFWPETSEQQARTNLRQLLHHLRNALPQADEFIVSGGSSIQWRVESPFELDIEAFRRAVTLAEEADNLTSRLTSLEKAIDLYGGDLLPGCYDDWILSEREQLEQAYLHALAQAALILEDHRDYEAAIGYAQRLLAHDPLHETTYRRLMRLYALNGERASALRVYHTCSTTLRDELGVEPSEATQDAYHQLLQTQIPDILRSGEAPRQVARQKLVGRVREWQAMHKAWQQVETGDTHCVLLEGEAGIGKSRLAEEMLVWAEQQGIPTARTRSYATEGKLAYSPVTEWLRSQSLYNALSSLDSMWLTEVARLLPELRLEFPDLPEPEPMTAGWQRRRFYEALARAFFALKRKIVLLLDDIQWCDQDTLEWLQFLFHFASDANTGKGQAGDLMLIGAMRPEEVNDSHEVSRLILEWSAHAQMTVIKVAPLSREDTVTLTKQVAGAELDHNQTEAIYRATEGHPLFVVEMVRTMMDRPDDAPALSETLHFGAPGLPASESDSNMVALPPKVQAVITARLASLSEHARDLACLAATIGREFTFAVLALASDSDESELVQGLDELWQRRIIREQGSHAYDFSHDSIREAAYAGTSQARRRLLHRRVGHALESAYADQIDSYSSQIASHFEKAGLWLRAIEYYSRAAALVIRVYANTEAVHLWRLALNLLRHLPQTTAREEMELSILIAMGAPLVALQGYHASEVRRVYSRAMALGRRLKRGPNPPILRALAISHVGRSELQKSYELGSQLLEIANQQSDPLLFVEARYVLGVTRFWQGEFVKARNQFTQALTDYEPNNNPQHIALYSQNPQVTCLVRLALTNWFLGRPAAALAEGNRAVALAGELSHPLTSAYAYTYCALLHYEMGDPRVAEVYAQLVLELSVDRGLGFWPPAAHIISAWSQAKTGRMLKALSSVDRAIAEFTKSEQTLHLPYAYVLAAQVYLTAGDTEAAQEQLDRAFAQSRESGQKFLDAELYRLQGDCLVLHTQSPDEGDAEVAYQNAIDIARRQSTLPLQLRAARSLAHLWAKQNRPQQARDLLASVLSQWPDPEISRDVSSARRTPYVSQLTVKRTTKCTRYTAWPLTERF